MPTAIQQYLRAVDKTLAAGNATEHSYRPAFKALVESFAKNIVATNEPKRVKCGAPDFIVDRKGAPVGYIECKDIGVSLDETEKSDQLRRYFDGLENLILTDYLEFRYYVEGRQRMHVVLARVDAKGKLRPMEGAEDQLATLFSTFLAAEPKIIGTSKDLAARMANIAKVIRAAIETAFGVEGEAGTLHGEYESFRATILNELTPAQFADMYAQTVCYGLFSARVNVPTKEARTFSREHAAYDLPATNPFLREVFDYIAGTKLDPSIVWAVDLLAEILRRSDMSEILKDFGKAARREDPVVHFYETFLAAYDPAMRESRGVYYTPEPVVSYIVRSIDAILKFDFACPAGLADSNKIKADFSDITRKGGKVSQEVHRVQILDPAAGTGTFLYETIRQIHASLAASRGTWAGERGYVAQHLLPRLYGFELMMAPYAVAHLKLGWLLKETGYDFAASERLRVYLTNTLEEAEIVAGPLLALADQIAREANAAGKVKTECPIMVVMGNPPYSGLSANMNKWVDDLLKKPLPLKGGAQGYYEVDGQPLGEKKVWLQDDYVKFIRFAQYRIELTGYGVLGFITNHGYLDNPTFRGMRQSLMQTFDEIHVIDLHGNSKKKEKPPDGGVDKNVFDIQQGVAIGIFVKRKSGRPKKPAKVFHGELWGRREAKYEWLYTNEVRSTKWKSLNPNSPYYFFVPRDDTLRVEYEAWPQVNNIFTQNVTGILTARDNFVIDFEDKPLLDRVYDLRNGALGDSDLRDKYFPKQGSTKKYPAGDSRGWKLPKARQALRNDPDWQKRVATILYRPFDARRIYYAPCMVDWPRLEMMPHMLAGDNLGLIFMRQVAMGESYTHFGVSRHVVDNRAFYSNKGIMSLAPLYLYPSAEAGKDKLFSEGLGPGKGGRRANLAPEFVSEFDEKLGLAFVPDGTGDLKKTFGPEDIFHYAYAIFHSPTYRKRYAEFLKIDFPRLPLTGDKALLARLCKLGAELVGLHLLERVPSPQATYPEAGDNIVEKPHYKPPIGKTAGRVYVNQDQYFENVPPEVWEFHVGGYQVCEKWLKDRKARTLSYDDIETYRKITEALRQTIRLMDEIDRAIPAWPLM
jgi:predicted helicase